MALRAVSSGGNGSSSSGGADDVQIGDGAGGFEGNSNFTSDLSGNTTTSESLLIGTGTARGPLDINTPGVTYAIDDVVNGSLDFSYGSGAYFANGFDWAYTIYAYLDSPAGRVYSVNGYVLSAGDNGSSDPMQILGSWDAVSGATGYRIIVTEDDEYGATGNYYFDTTDVNFDLNDPLGHDDISGHDYAVGSTVTPTTIASGANLYVDTNGVIQSPAGNIEIAPNLIVDQTVFTDRVESNTGTGHLRFSGFDSVLSNSDESAYINIVEGDGIFTSGNISTQGGNITTEGANITSGNITAVSTLTGDTILGTILGIGTLTPSYPFDVQGDSDSQPLLFNLQNTSGGTPTNYATMQFYGDSLGRSAINCTGHGAAGGAYFTAEGVEEAWFNVICRSNSSGNQIVRFGNKSNVFGIQFLNDGGTSITGTPFTLDCGTPNNTLAMTAAGGVNIASAKMSVDINGNITKIRNVTTSFPASQGANGTMLTNDGAGNLSWSNGAYILAIKTGINAKSVANTLVYTVPAGKTAIITGYVVRCTAASAITVGASAGLGFPAGTSNIVSSQAMTGLTTTTTTFNMPVVGISVQAAAASAINFNLGTAATGTSQTLSVDLMGYLL